MRLIDADVFSKSDPIVSLADQSVYACVQVFWWLFCSAKIQQAEDGKSQFGRTEIIWNNLNPDFVKKFIIQYFFEKLQKLKFEVYDVDSASSDLNKHDFLGRTECTLGDIVSSNRLTKKLDGPKSDSGQIIISAEELSSCKEEVKLHFCAHKLDKKDFFGKSDPFLTFYRSNEDGSFTVVHRTEVIKQTLNPTWQPFSISVRSVCNGDYERVIKVECYDWDADGGHDFIGSFTTTLRDLSRGPGPDTKYECINPKKKMKKGKSYHNSGVCINPKKKMKKGKSYHNSGVCINPKKKMKKGKSYHNSGVCINPKKKMKKGKSYHNSGVCINPKKKMKKGKSYHNSGVCINPKKKMKKGKSYHNSGVCINPKKKMKKGKSYHNSGVVELISCKIEKVHTFLDYISGGTKIHCTFAVDFTASNGDPKSPTSLHYMNPYRLNPYATSIKAVGDIIQDYDSAKMFPALGFGARLPPDGVVSHEFALNGNPNNPYCTDIQGVLDAYHSTLYSVQLYGPTNFAPCINHVARFAATAQNGNDYFILLIITDGIITDMPQTMEAIVNASSLPLSIIIIGVGDADFEAMEVLDGDEVRLSSRGKTAERDIVQFVPMRDFLGHSREDSSSIQARLAKEVLEEIPHQFLSYMKKNNIKPKLPICQQ